MKKTWILLTSALVLGIVVYFLVRKPVDIRVSDGGNQSPTTESIREKVNQFNDLSENQGANPSSGQGQTASGTQPSPSASNPWHELQNPEMTQSLVTFAEKLSPKMEEAEGNLEKAREFFTELEGCVADSKTNASPIQALCLSTAEELAEIHPEMMERYRSLRANAPGTVTMMLDAADAMDE